MLTTDSTECRINSTGCRINDKDIKFKLKEGVIMKLTKISESEMQIMKIIWKRNEPISTASILEELPKEKSWKTTTVMTLLSRLIDKGVLEVKKIGKLNHHIPKVTEEEYKAIQSNMFLEDMYNGSVKNFMATLYNNNNISKEDISELKKWIDEV